MEIMILYNFVQQNLKPNSTGPEYYPYQTGSHLTHA